MSTPSYAAFVASRLKSDESIIKGLLTTKGNANLLHCAAGVASEAGELLDAIKKAAIYNKPLDRENVIEELGDLEFFMEGIRAQLKITREDTLRYNVQKLEKRYATGYSDAAAQARADKAGK